MGVTALGVGAELEIGVVVGVWLTVMTTQNAELIIKHNRPYSMACNPSKSLLSNMTWMTAHTTNTTLLLFKSVNDKFVRQSTLLPASEPNCNSTLCYNLVTSAVTRL